MRKLFSILAVILCALCATAQQTDQYFWLNGKLMFGTQIAQTDSITFGSAADQDTLRLILPRTVTVIQKETVYIEVHDTLLVLRCPDDVEDGVLPGEFSISATKKVHFSQGNLQYVGKWQFAEHQWEMFGTNQRDDHRDLFGWGTGDEPNRVIGVDSYYPTFVDWGMVNAISNGGNIPKAWRTLTIAEWTYLFCTRTNATTLCALGSINGVNGVILLPDNWVLPEGSSFTPSSTNGLTYDGDGSKYYNGNGENYSDNTYTAEQWAVLEAAGAVFLPAGGLRRNSNVTRVGSDGYYWTPTPVGETDAYYLYFDNCTIKPTAPVRNRYVGHNVRLVH